MQREDLPLFPPSAPRVMASPDAAARDRGRSGAAPVRRPAARGLATTAALALAVVLAACSRPAPAPEPVRAVRTVKAGAEALGGGVDYAGEVRARTESRLGFRVGGKLVRRAVELGDNVRAGQLLAQLDPQDLKLAQEAAQAGLLAAQTSHDQALADQRRSKELFDQGFISAAELERRDNALKSAAASLAQARAQVNVQGNQTAYAQLAADVSGVVTGIDAEPGAVLGAGTPVLRIAQDGARDVVFQVPEDRVKSTRALLGRKNALMVSIWGTDQGVPATLRELAAAADPSTRSFVAKADIGGADVRLGQTATVSLATGAAAGAAPAIKLPLEAVAEQGGKTVVWLLDAATMTVSPQPVTLAPHEGRRAVIAAGLKPGQEVVVAGVHTLSPGLRVKRYFEPVSGGATLGSASEGGPVAAQTAAAGPASATAAARPLPASAARDPAGAMAPSAAASGTGKSGTPSAASAVAVR